MENKLTLNPKRRWPDLFMGKTMSVNASSVEAQFKVWLEANLSKEELARIAPVICDHERILVESFPKDLLNVRCADCGARVIPTGWEEV